MHYGSNHTTATLHLSAEACTQATLPSEMERDETYFLESATFLVSSVTQTQGWPLCSTNMTSFKVSNRLFKVPRRPFEQGSTYLGDLLLSSSNGPPGNNDVVELHNIEILDFQKLLRLLFPLYVNSRFALKSS
jgi:hypothetical protein